MNRRPLGDPTGTSATMPQLAREHEAFGMERLPYDAALSMHMCARILEAWREQSVSKY